MKKNYLWIILLCSSFLLACTAPESTKKIKSKNIAEKYPFYQEENKKRYQAYQEKNKDLTEKEIIVRVNLNLDQPFYTNTEKSKDLNQQEILVNKHFYLEKDYVPDNLIELDQTISKGGIYLVEEARDAFQKLVKDAKKEGVSVRAVSAYRSYHYQASLYNRYVEKEGTSKADTYSARPGFSEHQTGLSLDIDDTKVPFTEFEETESFQWMKSHAHDYGFILRYPKGKENITGYTYEPWHYRYVGRSLATSVKQKNLTWDEYYAEFIRKK